MKLLWIVLAAVVVFGGNVLGLDWQALEAKANCPKANWNDATGTCHNSPVLKNDGVPCSSGRDCKSGTCLYVGGSTQQTCFTNSGAYNYGNAFF